MANEYFTTLRSYFHTFSRAFSMMGQNFVDQAPLKSGHNLTTKDIRAEEIPFVNASYLLTEIGEGTSSILSGTEGSRTVISDYENILKFYDGVDLTVMENTNNETYRLVVNGSVINGFIDPTDKFSSDGSSTANGYSMSLLDSNGVKIPAKSGQTWTFDPYNGTVQFANGEGPTSHVSWGNIKIRAFAYIGKRLDTKLSESIGGVTNVIPAIKPYTFDLSKMTYENNKYFIDIPGFVIKVSDADGNLIGESVRKPNGDTRIIFDLDSDEITALTGVSLIAYALVNNDGTKINILESQEL